MVNAANLELCLRDLESGEFTQGRGSLRSTGEVGDTWCCLGVFCERYRRETGDGEWLPQVRSASILVFRVAGHNEYGVMPEAVCAWLGLRANPQLQNSFQGNAAECNDKGWPFPKIARAFRTRYLAVP
jgi:hypothetical protein